MLAEILNRLAKVDQFIEQKKTGTIKQLAKNVGLEEKVIYAYMDLLNKQGIKLKYYRAQNTYYYVSNKL
jgi:predicted DNA-binding transcriptional regulator YafY